MLLAQPPLGLRLDQKRENHFFFQTSTFSICWDALLNNVLPLSVYIEDALIFKSAKRFISPSMMCPTFERFSSVATQGFYCCSESPSITMSCTLISQVVRILVRIWTMDWPRNIVVRLTLLSIFNEDIQNSYASLSL